ncbi:hypothetical protein MVEN_00753700 [Mycena venus]|uniref:Transmembrane protein n=1 Tax=Mycena venus TaxID=2733690 RepID=A0A8H7D311_9AGAR|nr:hypothetical protein MVEN_00753700 [Mycena venus]
MIPLWSLTLSLAVAFHLASVPSIHGRASVRLIHDGARVPDKGIVRRDVISSGLASASWIWTANSNNASAESVAFLKSFNTPPGKTASSAVISITAVESWTLWANGQPLAASGTGTDAWKSAHVVQAALNATQNMFAVLVCNSGSTAPPPGLLAAIQVSYTDSTNSTVVSDSSWLASSDIPSDFPSPSVLSQFASVTVEASYGSGPWGQNIALPSSDPSPLNLQGSTWIWSTTNSYQVASVGTVGFRRTFPSPSGKSAQFATALLTADNTFAFYLGKTYIGSPPADHNLPGDSSIWLYPQQFRINLNSTLNVFNVIAQNFPAQGTTDPSSAGFIAAIQVHYTDGSSDIIRTDTSWLTGDSSSVPVFLSTSDSLLSPSIAQGPLGMAPWGPFISNADVLAAGSVPTPPFNALGAPPSPANTSPHSVPVATIVAPIVSVLAVAGMIIAFFAWRSSRSSKKQTGLKVVTPFSRYTAVPSVIVSDTSRSDGTPSRSVDNEAPPPGYSYDEPEHSLAVESDPLVFTVNGGPPRHKQQW